jgi:hypothetical protein
MPTPICNDQGSQGDTPCTHPATVVVRLLDERYFADQAHAELTRDENAPGDVAVYPMTYDAERNLATWAEGDQPHTAAVIGLPEGGTALRLLSPKAELRCLDCGVVEFKADATVPVSIELDTEEGSLTAVKVLEERIGPPTQFRCENGHPADEHLAAALLALSNEGHWPRWTVG